MALSSYVQGRKAAGNVRSQALDFTQEFNNRNTAIQAEKAKAAAQQGRIDEIMALSEKGWNKGQEIIDEKIQALKDMSLQSLVDGDGEYSSKDLRAIQTAKQELVGEVTAQANAKASHEQYIADSNAAQKRNPVLYDEETTLANHDAIFYQTDENGQPVIGEDGEKVLSTDYRNQDYANVIRMKEPAPEAPEPIEDWTYKGVPFKTSSSNPNKEGGVTKSSSTTFDKETSMSNALKAHRAAITSVAQARGYDSPEDWADDKDGGYEDYMMKRILSPALGTGYSKTEGKDTKGWSWGGWKRYNNANYKPTPVNINSQTKIGEDDDDEPIYRSTQIYTNDGANIYDVPIKVQYTYQTFNPETNQLENKAGSYEGSVSQIYSLPVLKKGAKYNELLKGMPVSAGLTKKLEASSNGSDVRFTPEEVKTIKKIAGDKYGDYFESKTYMSGKKGELMPIEELTLDAYKEGIMNKGATEEQADAEIENIRSFGRARQPKNQTGNTPIGSGNVK